MMVDRPWKLIPTTVRGAGGREIGRFRMEAEPRDTPSGAEAWIGSTTKANGSSPEDPYLGCSRVILPDGTQKYLFESIEENPEKVLGKDHMQWHGKSLGILMKLLDAKNEYPLQSHPTRETAKRLWNGIYGKEEAWYILSVREDAPEPPYILLGFKPGIMRENFRSAYLRGDMDSIRAFCHAFIVHPGETYFVPSGMPHALGAGCFVVEVQEPSDYTAVPIRQSALIEYRRKANPKGVFAPIDEALYTARTLETFDYIGRSRGETEMIVRGTNKILREGAWGHERLIIGREKTKYFSCTILDVHGEVTVNRTDSIRIGLVCNGEGTLRCAGSEMCLRRGDELFFPYQTEDIRLSGCLSIIVCAPGPAEE